MMVGKLITYSFIESNIILIIIITFTDIQNDYQRETIQKHDDAIGIYDLTIVNSVYSSNNY